jgi:hypothetical protein
VRRGAAGRGGALSAGCCGGNDCAECQFEAAEGQAGGWGDGETKGDVGGDWLISSAVAARKHGRPA